jgi:hypothetical protein
LSSLKTLLIPAQEHASRAFVNVSGRYFLMAGFEVSTNGRFWVSAEALKFSHQFGIEDAYVAIECKRVGLGMATLNGRYVSEGVDRFVTGKYAGGHEWGFMLGYVLVLPVEKPIESISTRIVRDYPGATTLSALPTHPKALAVLEGALVLVQAGGHDIKLRHIFVDMVPALADA